MDEANSKPTQHDPGAELGRERPVRDQERLGDRKYSVTPPRSKVRAPAEAESGRASCHSCRAHLDPADSFRVDAAEYVYHFCGTECYQRWQRADDTPRAG